MNEFQYDVMQKKRIARGAYAKKNGSKSKRCTLPSDYMTPAQIKKLSKDVCSVRMNSPIKYDDFKKLPPDIRDEYIGRLRSEYNASFPQIAAMMGCSVVTLKTRINEGSTKPGSREHKRMSKQQMSVWENFCKYGTKIIEKPTQVQEPVPDVTTASAEPEEAAIAEPDSKCIEPVIETNKKFTLQKFTLEYTNTNDFQSILSDLMMVAGGRQCEKIIIIASFNDE